VGFFLNGRKQTAGFIKCFDVWHCATFHVSCDNSAFSVFKVFMVKAKLLSNIFYLIVRSGSHESSFHSGTPALFINTVDKAACFG
jgi:hypothetical protein